MTGDEQIRTYLRSVQSSLHVPRKQRRRILEEIESHIQDGSAEHMRVGATRSQAVALAIEELGPPAIVGVAFAEDPPPVERITGVRRWLPLVLPVGLLVIAICGIAWAISTVTGERWTRGAQLQMWWYVRTGVIAALLTYGASSAIRRADRDPAWRWGAWACTGSVAMYLLLEYADRLHLILG
jgi:hypothetical protein